MSWATKDHKIHKKALPKMDITSKFFNKTSWIFQHISLIWIPKISFYTQRNLIIENLSWLDPYKKATQKNYKLWRFLDIRYKYIYSSCCIHLPWRYSTLILIIYCFTLEETNNTMNNMNDWHTNTNKNICAI